MAAAAGVSIATVSRVLRTPDAVRETTRGKVLAVVADLGYVPSGNARALAGRRTGVLGLLFPGHDAIDADPDPGSAGPVVGGVTVRDDRGAPVAGGGPGSPFYFDEVLRGAEIEAWRQGFALLVAAGRGPSVEVLLNDVAGRVDGLAVVARTVPAELLTRVNRRVPVVVLADTVHRDEFDHVGVDNAEGMRVLAGHVLQTLGVRDVVYVAGPSDSPDEHERFEGFRAALAAAGLPRRAVPVLRGDFSRGRAAELMAELLAERVPRAVVCANDQTALGVLDATRARGLSVPGDVLVTGFDGIEATRFSDPPLTTVAQPMVQLGRAAVRSVVDRLSGPQTPPRSVRLPVEVLLRESCPPAR
ncbi:LacI family DNA-binding transcriptional regulator [Kineococcus gynurae]|uniref:LacI family DNA-binding transcriptional regulator n=1 Tax=Kineococcus gynurae TaxID=452979 RepID=A0ABV5LPG6_9ACTN